MLVRPRLVRATCALLLAVVSLAAFAAPRAPGTAKALPNPILFVTQFPVPNDFATIGSVFANHRGSLSSAGRGGDLYIRYPDGTLRNLTAEAGFGSSGFQGANAIAVRDPEVHWSGTKAVFSMVVGAPTQQFQVQSYYWQLYEVTGFGVGETVSITKVANQPLDTNNVQPAYLSDGTLVFVSDRPRGGERHLYPQHDEYESTPTPTGLWRLDPASGALTLLQHSPSGSFTPTVDSFGRVVFTRWDHLQRDQQAEADVEAAADGDPPVFGTFDYADESAAAAILPQRTETFPEPRIAAEGSILTGHRFNHFFPWQINQDGTEEETLNHLGRHELHAYFDRNRTDDPNLSEFVDEISGRTNPREVLNLLMLREDPTQAGRYYAIDAPEFATHSGGQLVRFAAPPSTNPDDVVIEYLSPRSSFGIFGDAAPPADYVGRYRHPLPMSDGQLVASHAPESANAENLGTRNNPQAAIHFRVKRLADDGNGTFVPVENLTPDGGIVKTVSWFDPDELVSYTGPFWELSPVEVRARPVPPATGFALRQPEQQTFDLEDVDPAAFRAWLAERGLAVFVMRNVTTRDRNDEQQPYNLAVAGAESTVGDPGTLYAIAHMQFFQGDQVRGIGRRTPDDTPNPGRRVLPREMHDPATTEANGPNPGGPAGSVPIFDDGSVALFVPARRALTWQATDAGGTPVIRERYWITAQPGEVRACDGCHGVNTANQAGEPAAQNVSLAFRDLLQRWKSNAPLFADGFEDAP